LTVEVELVELVEWKVGDVVGVRKGFTKQFSCWGVWVNKHRVLEYRKLFCKETG